MLRHSIQLGHCVDTLMHFRVLSERDDACTEDFVVLAKFAEDGDGVGLSTLQ